MVSVKTDFKNHILELVLFRKHGSVEGIVRFRTGLRRENSGFSSACTSNAGILMQSVNNVLLNNYMIS